MVIIKKKLKLKLKKLKNLLITWILTKIRKKYKKLS